MVFIPENNRTKQFINFDTIYKLFQNWYIDTYPGSSLPSKLDAFEEIKKKLKLEKDTTMSRVRINSYRLKTTAEIMGDTQDDGFNPQFGNMSIDNESNESNESNDKPKRKNKKVEKSRKNKKDKKNKKNKKDDSDSDSDDLDNSDESDNSESDDE